MGAHKTYLFFLVAALCHLMPLHAQELGGNSPDPTRHRIGFNIGYGNQGLGLNVNYDYRINLIQLQYNYVFISKSSWQLDILVQPQYNFTDYSRNMYDPELLTGTEFGINFGLVFRKNIVDNLLSLYGLVSTGPHSVSGVPDRQRPGFLFSNNFFGGLTLELFKGTLLDFRLGFRHISNANLWKPNGGINNIVIGGGLLFNLN